jgi:uncharacterized protein (DUF305 family)
VTVSLGRAAAATVALMFLTGAGVYTWTQANDDPSPNAVDIGFYDDMQAHHLQGVTMALSYLHDGTDPVLQSMAREIVLVQAGEVRLMGQALEDWGSPEVDQETAMDWMGMPVPQLQQPGMATDAELEQLDQAEGEELDDLFTRLMITHHRGGIHMAEFAAEHGGEGSVRRLAEAMVTTQRSEVGEMNLRREMVGLDQV